MWWKNLVLPIQCLMFGFVVALLVMVIAYYLDGGQRGSGHQRLCSSYSYADCKTGPRLAPVYLPGEGRR